MMKKLLFVLLISFSGKAQFTDHVFTCTPDQWSWEAWLLDATSISAGRIACPFNMPSTTNHYLSWDSQDGYITRLPVISLTTTGSGAASYSKLTGVLNIPTPDFTPYVLTSTYTTGLAGKFNTPSGTTAQYIRGDGSLATFPSAATKTFNNNVSRSLNSNYTVSTTRDVDATYSINVSWNLAALLSGSASAFLEYSTNAGSTWNTVSQVSKSIGLLTFAGADDLNLTGLVPANALVRIRTTSSNMTVTFSRGQEVLN